MSLIKRPQIIAAMGAAALALSGCVSGEVGVTQTGALARTPLDQYKASVIVAPEQVQIAVHAEGLSDRQRAALDDFAGRWREAGQGEVTVRTPNCVNGDETDALRATASAIDYLQQRGVPVEAIRQARYDAADAKAPIIASFTRYRVATPDCATKWDNLVATNGNGPTKHLGCATVSNMAAMAADPHDLIAPAPSTPGDNVRRQTILSKYREGKVTASEKDAQANGAVSKAVSQ